MLSKIGSANPTSPSDATLSLVPFACSLPYSFLFYQVNNVAIVFASDDDSPATVLTMSIDECLPFYYEWQGRLQQYKKYTEEIEHIELFDVNG